MDHFSWRGELTDAQIERWICACDVTLFHSFEPDLSVPARPVVVFKLRKPEVMEGNVPENCFSTNGRVRMDPDSDSEGGRAFKFIVCEIKPASVEIFNSHALPWLHFNCHTPA